MHPVLSPEHPLGGQQAGLQLLADVELRAGGLLAVVAGPGARVQGPGGHRVGGVTDAARFCAVVRTAVRTAV